MANENELQGGEAKPVLQPVLTPSMRIISITEEKPVIMNGMCLICQVDPDGNEVPDTEFTTSLRMWDRTYSKNKKFHLKKK